MRLDLYQAETTRVASEQGSLLETARQRLLSGHALSPLEQNGVLHALQVLIENAIGKAKQLLKAKEIPVPVSAYDAFAIMVQQNMLADDRLTEWNAVVGLRNKIVHDYMNIDMAKVLEFVRQEKYRFIIEFLLA